MCDGARGSLGDELEEEQKLLTAEFAENIRGVRGEIRTNGYPLSTILRRA
jgi:hypothetical protein